MAHELETLTVSSGTVAADTVTRVKTDDFYWKYFGFLVIAGFLMRLACFTGLIGSDDVVGYSHFAQLVAQLNYRPELHHFALRYGLIIPVGILYRFFGVGEWTTILLPLLASTASVLAVMLSAAKLFDERTALISGVLMATFPLELRYATILVPEPIAELYVLVAVLVYLHWGAEKPASAGLISGLCIGVAYLTKEPTLFIAPVLVVDALTTRKWRTLFGLASGLLIIAGVEHVYYAAVTGDLMFRPHAMIHHNESLAAVDANQHLWSRLFTAYPEMMIVPTSLPSLVRFPRASF